MKYPPKTIPFLSYGGATKNAINQNCPHFAQNLISTTLTNITITTNATTESE